jgi:hypothetical protein
MSDGPQYLEFEVSIWSQTVRIPMWKGSELEKKYLLWKSTEDDDDFEDLAAWVRDDIADEIEFHIEDVN